MATPSNTIQEACQLLRKRARFRDASIQLPGGPTFPTAAERKAFRESIRNYVESWITPLLDAIETGDTAALRHSLSCDPRRESIDTDYHLPTDD